MFALLEKKTKIELKVKEGQNKKESLELKKSLADKIEQYLKVLIERSDNQQIIIQRVELAETFSCVPSQVTYVINTRFRESEGYFAESRRGGKGYMRITKVADDDPIVEINRIDLFEFFDELYKEKNITKNENELLKHLVVYSFKELKPTEKKRLFKTMRDALEDFIK